MMGVRGCGPQSTFSPSIDGVTCAQASMLSSEKSVGGMKGSAS